MRDGPMNGEFDVLVVDDRAEDLVAFRAVLEGSGFTVVTATSGQAALRALLHQSVALIVLDRHLPDIDGFQLATAIKERTPSRETPILFLTSSEADLPSLLRAFGVGGVDYIVKPVNAEVLRSRVAVFVELRRKTMQLESQASQLRKTERAVREAELALLRADSERHQRTLAEAAAKQAERLCEEAKQAVAVREDFLAIASHELRTPLTSVILGLQHLGRELDEGSARDQLQAIERQMRRISRLADELVDVTQIDKGVLRLRPEAVEVRGLVEEVVERFRPEAARAGCQIALATAGPRLDAVWDPMRMEQVLINLLSNASKYGRGRPIAVTLQTGDGKAAMTVSDEGIGISPEHQERIFGRFERAVSPRSYGGLGLGLYVVKAIVDAHGGQIEIDSSPDAGTKVRVLVPTRIPVSAG